jgi:hypothetical protein
MTRKYSLVIEGNRTGYSVAKLHRAKPLQKPQSLP